MQFTTLIRARTPHLDCSEHGVKTMQVPWAAPQERFTLLFERFAMEVLLASASVSQACALLGIGWDNRPGDHASGGAARPGTAAIGKAEIPRDG